MVSSILKEAQQKGVQFYLNESQQLAFKAPPGALEGEFKARVIANKAALIESLKAATQAPKAVERAASMPLSFAQQRLWFIDMLDGGSVQYNIPMALKLTGNLNNDGLQFALDALISRHEILRTVYESHGGEGRQKICAADSMPLKVFDLSTLAGYEQTKQLSALRAEIAGQPFDLKKDLMLRAALVKVKEGEHVLLMTLHHIAADGWSMGILVKEFTALYCQFISKQVNALPKLDIQYVDYAVWQQKLLKSAKFTDSLEFWRHELTAAPTTHSLPLDHPRPVNQSFVGAQVQKVIPKSQLQQLERLAIKYDCTLFMLLHSAFAVLLARWSRQQDVLIGTPHAGRNHRELENVIGFFINSLVLRSQVELNEPFNQFLKRSRNKVLQAFNHQEVPFEQLLEVLNTERSLSHTPLFQIMFSMQNFSQSTLQLPELSIESLQPSEHVAKFDLDLSATVTDSGLQLNWLYASALFSEHTIESMADSFNCLISAIIACPEQDMGKLPLSKAPLSLKSVSKTDNERVGSLPHHWVERVAQCQPESTALKSNTRTLSYADLNKQANALAQSWLQQGVSKGDKVAVSLAPSELQLTSLLAIWKLGATFVPIDPDYPLARIEHILSDSNAAWLLADSGLFAKLESGEWKPLEVVEASVEANVGNQVSVEDCAYIIYTSGTTGKPKGVMVSYGALSSHIAATSDALSINAQDTLLPYASLSVDAALDLSLSAWYQGAALAIRPAGIPSAEAFYQLCHDLDVNVVDLPPAYLVDLLSQPQTAKPFWLSGQMKLVIVGGEAMSPTIMRCWSDWQLFEHCHLVNAYGPTETVITATLKRFTRLQPITIGQPIARRQAYVLDEFQQSVPEGAVGELYIAGQDLAEGYLGLPALSAERFIQHPRYGRMYKTGDLVRVTAQQELTYCGRIDEQVQIRGFRVEPMEVRAAILSLPFVHECFVKTQVLHKQTELVAYVQLDYLPECEDITLKLYEDLQDVLAAHMIPARFAIVEVFQYTDNGKIDLACLPEIDRDESTGVVSPRNEQERKMCDIWQSHLAVPVLCIKQNFFALGGHSLVAVKVVSDVAAQFGIQVSVRDLFSHSTVERFVAYIKQQDQYVMIPPRNVEYIPLSYQQQRLWFLHQLEDGSSQYNMPVALKLNGQLDKQALVHALSDVIARHSALRTHYVNLDGKGLQIIGAPCECELKELDISDSVEQTSELTHIINQDVAKSFDLEKDQVMMRVTLIKLAAQSHAIIVNTHHIASDGWSVGIIVKDFSHAYSARAAGNTPSFSPLAIEYADFAVWQRANLDSELDNKISFWKSYLADAPVVHGLPLDYKRPTDFQYQGRISHQSIDATVLAGLNDIAQSNQVTLFNVLQTAFSVFIARWSDSEDVLLGTPVAGRERPELQDVVGLFVNTLVLRTEVDVNSTFDELLADNTAKLKQAFAHQDVPFEMLIDRLQVERSTAHAPLFQIMFSMQNIETGELTLSNLEVESLTPSEHVAKFDLELSCGEVGGELKLTWNYATALFTEHTIARMMESFAKLLRGITLARSIPLADIIILPDEDNQKVIQWNETAFQFEHAVRIPEQFSWHAKQHGENNALQMEGQPALCYRELSSRVNQLANWLVAQGIKANDIVGVAAYRSYEMVIAIHGILKAGAAYLPIDPELPDERISFLVADSGMSLLLCHADLQAQFSGYAVPSFDIAAPQLSDYSDSEPNVKIAPSDAAYVIYTSGTTGKPKGVTIEHLALSNRINWMQHEYQLSHQDVVLQKTPFNFDVSVWEFVWPLSVGASLAIAKPEGHKDPLYLAEVISSYEVTCLHFVPSMLNVMLQSGCLARCDTLKQVFCSGEALPIAVTSAFHNQHDAKLHNLYGPTEATIDVSYWQSHVDSKLDIVPIGKPIHNIQLYVLDKALNPVPIGVPGELHIAGVGLAREYLNRPDLTAEKFVTTNKINGSELRVYKTGDLVRYLADGNIEYLGRNDHQVKINGFRVELGEIESRLLSIPKLQEAVVVARKLTNGALQLVAYYCATKPVSSEILADELSEALPHYMVPTCWMQLESMPLSANGKLDRKQLPELEQDEARDTFAMPVTDLQVQIAELWCRELNCDRVGLDDNFFHLGGDSIKAIAVVTKMNQAGMSVSVKDIFITKTVRKLSEQLSLEQTSQEHIAMPKPFELLTENERQAVNDIKSIDQLDDAYPLTVLQQGMFFYGALHEEQGVYHDVFNAKITESLKESEFTRALQTLVDEHEILRATLMLYGKRPLQLIHSHQPLPLKVIDISALDAERQQQAISLRLHELRSAPVQLERGYWQITLFKLNEGSFQYILDFHHAMWDGWSIASFNNRLFALYKQFKQNAKATVLAEHPLPYSYYVAAEQAALQSQAARAFWQQHLQQAQLPWWSQYHLTQSQTRTLVINSETTKQLTQVAQRLDVQEKSLLLAAHVILMALLSGKNNVLTSYVTNGRPELTGSEKTLGLFLNTVPMWQDLSAMSWDNAVQAVERTIHQAHGHRHFPVAEIQSMMNLDFSSSMFNYTNFHVYDGSALANKVTVEESFEQNNYLWATEVAKSDSSSGGIYHVKFSAEQSAFPSATLDSAITAFETILHRLITNEGDDIVLTTLLDKRAQQSVKAQLAVEDATQYDWVNTLTQFAQRHPDEIAIVYGQERLSYSQLVSNVQRTVNQLRHLGVKPGQVVALGLARSPRYIELLVALFEVGAVYLPIDPAHPRERIAYVLDDSAAEFVIVEQMADFAKNAGAVQFITLAQIQSSSAEPLVVSEKNHSAEHLAYLIYTSGSTGNPKGVMVSRQALNQFIYSASKRLDLNKSVEWLSLTTAIFDISLLEMIAPLCCGGKLHILDHESQRDGKVVTEYIQNTEVNFVQATPSGWKLLLATGWQGKVSLTGLTGGEALSKDLAAELLSRCGGGLVNCYGPTEATVWSHMSEVTENTTINLGEKLAGYGFCIVDENLEPVIPGVQGELLLTGHALANGYWQRPELTAEKFVQLPWHGNQRAYRTGDLVSLNEVGQLSYLGRMDEQVKIRGHRIELGEIESKLRELEFVAEAVVVTQQQGGNDVLAAYVQLSKKRQSDSDLRHQVNSILSQSLPDYMLPSFVMALDSLPMTPNGKLDKKRLPAPQSEQLDVYTAPQSETEQAVQDIWYELLGGQRFSTEARFFNVGGDSILATRLLTEINYRFDIEFTIKDIFSFQSIAEQALHIDFLKLDLSPTDELSDGSVAEMEW